MRILIYLFVCINFISFSQKNYKVEYAYKLSSELDYTEALPIWNEISETFISTNEGEWDYVRKTVEAAQKSEHYSKALYWDSIVVKSSVANKTDWLTYFQLLSINNKHELLPDAIDSALVLFPTELEIIKWKNDLPSIFSRLELRSDYTIKLIKTNSKGEEYCAFPYKNGFLYVSNDDNSGVINNDYKRSGQPFTDICLYDSIKGLIKHPFWKKEFWVKLIFKNQWRDIKNSSTHEGPIYFDQDYKTAFITNNQKEIDTSNRVKFSRLELTIYQRNGKTWKEIDFPFNNKSYSTGHAVLDTNNWIIFSSDRPGGFGGADLYKTKLINGKWEDPLNLGESVNTSGDELFPFVSTKGILYFSSNGWPGVGGLDVYYCDQEGSFPEPMGAPINTVADDFGININETTGNGFLSSNRLEWKDQIYSIKKPVYEINLVAFLKTCNGIPLVEKSILLIDLHSLKSKEIKTSKEGKINCTALEKGRKYQLIYGGDTDLIADSTIFSADSSGNYTVNLTSNYTRKITKVIALAETGEALENVMMKVYKSNGEIVKYLTKTTGSYTFINDGKEKVDSILVQLINHKDIMFKIPSENQGECMDTILLPIKLIINQGVEFIRLDLVLYNFDKYELRPEGKQELDKVVQYMKERPELRVELSSHTDSRGTFKYNIELSNNRSQSCVNYIISKGISPKMILAKGYGETKLVNECSDGVICTIEEHQANRRTELQFLTPENELLNNEQLEKINNKN